MILKMESRLMPSQAKRSRLAELVEGQWIPCNAALDERFDCYRKTGGPMAETLTRRFRMGDIVCAAMPSGKRHDVHVGRVAVQASASFNAQSASGTVQGVSRRHCRIAQLEDRYGHDFDTVRKEEKAPMHRARDIAFLHALKNGVSRNTDK